MKPAFRLAFDGADITANVADRLLELRITDEAGLESDELTLVVDNRDHRVPLPAKGATVDASLGYGTALAPMGSFVVDELSSEGGGSGRTLTVKAKAADMRSGLKERKTRAFVNATVGDVVAQIAGEHGLEPQVDPELAAIRLGEDPYNQIDQTDESDLHFLRRIAKRHDAVAKPAFGVLTFGRGGKTETFSGLALPTVELEEGDVESWSATAPDRGRYTAATATYLDTGTRERTTVVAGGGEPVFALTQVYPDANAAMAAAQAKLGALSRGEATLRLSGQGNPALVAETRLSFSTADELAAGDWVIVRAEHVLDGSGYRTDVDCEQPGAAKS